MANFMDYTVLSSSNPRDLALSSDPGSLRMWKAEKISIQIIPAIRKAIQLDYKYPSRNIDSLSGQSWRFHWQGQLGVFSYNQLEYRCC